MRALRRVMALYTEVRAAIAANRFGLGARPGDLARVAADPVAWLTRQLAAGAPLLSDPSLQPSHRILAQVLDLRRERRETRTERSPSTRDPQQAAQALQKLGRLYRPIYLAETTARLKSAVTSERPFIERLVHFWANHFAISADKLAVTGIAGAYEREAIRPHVLGKFGELLRSAEQHPAMLLYLDNHTSAGPNSKIAQRGGNAQRGPRDINENLARDILELHTLGVDGGYTQQDVTTFALVISGWSVSGPTARQLAMLRDPGHFQFRDEMHEPGPKQLLGKRYASDGLRQGEAVLADLATHPATARHIATKLARHFIADDPPPGAVDHLARVFLESHGDPPTVYRALIASEAAWAQPLAKFKTPSDYVVSASRALSLPVEDGRRAFASLEMLGQRSWTPGSPAGWPDRAADWDGAAAVFKRIEWADAVGSRIGSRQGAAQLAPDVLGATLSHRTRTALARAESGAQAITLFLSSPEFMCR
jgi:uncharacterized protein (DUF1800 family)